MEGLYLRPKTKGAEGDGGGLEAQAVLKEGKEEEEGGEGKIPRGDK